MSESVFPQIVSSSRAHCFHSSRKMGPASTCTRRRYNPRAFSGVRGKTRDGPVVLGSVLPLLTVIRKKLLYSVEQDENRHVLDRNTLIFSSLPLPSLLLPLSHSRTMSWGTGVWDLKTYICSARQNWIPALLLCFAAVINFACGSAGSAAC